MRNNHPWLPGSSGRPLAGLPCTLASWLEELATMATIAFVTTAWGPRHGGINAFNTDLCTAVAALHRDLQVVCFALEATREEIANAEARDVTLVPMQGMPKEFTPAHRFELNAKAQTWSDLEWWIGHDVHSGYVAVEAAEETRTRAAVIWHTDHISYAAHKPKSPGKEIIDRNRREAHMLRRAAAVFGVGPTLAEAAADRLEGTSSVIELLPGLAPIEPLEASPPTFRPITYGRLGREDDVIKRGTLAILAFAQLVNEAPDIAGRDPRMTVIGIGERRKEERRLRKLAVERAGRKVVVVGQQFTEDREQLFGVLRGASACLMLSLHEGFGLVGWEAIAAGVPLIITRNSGLHRLLEAYEDAAGLGRVLTVDVKGGERAAEDDIAAVTARLRQIAREPDTFKIRALALRGQFSACTWEKTARTLLGGLGYVTAGARTPSPTLTLPKSNLPLRADQFFEWPQTIASCKRALAESRLVTLVGPPGAGKTRLAVELANTLLDDFDQHVYFVDLSKVADPELVVSRITHALKIEAGEPVTDALKEVFRETQALVVLDTFDRLLAAADAVQDLLEQVPGLTVLATSREPLGIRPERLEELPPLPPDLAANLFLARVPKGTLALPAPDDPRLLRLCERLDYLPLAIELVAPRAQLYSIEPLLARVEEGLITFKARHRDVAEYHATLEAAFEFSHELLQPSQRRLFAELSVFAGGCTIETAASVLRGSDPGALEEDLFSLLDKRLLRHDLRGGQRFVMPQTLRAYATERLKGPGAHEVRARHAAHFLAYAEAATPGELQDELENLAAALRHFARCRQTGEALGLAALLAEFWWSRDFAEGWQRLSEVLDLTAAEPLQPAEAHVRLWAGRLAIRLGKLDEAAEAFDRALTIAKREEAPDVEAQALADRALVHMEHAEFEAARPLLERALTMQRQRPAGDGLADTLDNLGVLATAIGDYDTAEQRLHESLTLYQNEIGTAWVHNDLAWLALVRNDLGLADDHATRALAIGMRRPDLAIVAWARNYLGLVASERGELDHAREHHDESLKLVLLLGDRRVQALALEGFAALAVEEREPRRALLLAGASERRRTEARIPRTRAESANLERRLVRARAALGRDADAAYAAGMAMSLDEAVAVARAT